MVSPLARASPLVIFALYCRSIATDIPRSVLDKTHTSARAGQQITDSISNARSGMPRPGLDNMRFGSFYLDSACTVVLAAILCDPSNQDLAFGYLASIDRAIKYLEKRGSTRTSEPQLVCTRPGTWWYWRDRL